MNKNSAQFLSLIIIVLVVFTATFALSNKENEIDSTSFNRIYHKVEKPNSESNQNSIMAFLSSPQNKSDITGISLPSFKTKSTVTNSESSNVDFPISGVSQLDVQHSTVSSTASTNVSKSNYMRGTQITSNQMLESNLVYSKELGTTAYTSLETMFLLTTESRETAKTNQGSKRAIERSKTTSSSTNLTDKNNAKKVLDDPGDPGSPSLAMGDGIHFLLLALFLYAIERYLKFSSFLHFLIRVCL